MKKYGLIGNPLDHSFSPQIHALLGDYEYKLYPMPEENVIPFLQSGLLHALNVTIPYKETVIPALSYISDEARRIGSVNTIVRKSNNALYGYNTDYYGFTAMLNYYGLEPKGKKALVLGSGGASKTVRTVLADMGASEVITVSRSGENNYKNLHLHRDAGLIVNTTPLGMYPKNGVAAVDLRDFPNCSGVADIVYNPGKTALLLQAEELGLPCAYGLSMLVAQAIRAAEYFFDKSYPEDTLPSVLSRIAAKMRNTVLVGMPGCGKTTVGKILAQKLDKEFIDSDEEITKRTGITPAEWITGYGEAKFREIESQVLEDLGKLSGKVIATGGGAVTVEANRAYLRQNGSVFFINRELELLGTDGRPLSGDIEVRRALYQKRLPMYRSFSDVELTSGKDAEAGGTASAIASAFLKISERG
ncbi:MAG: shikimate kinase [Clostridia bacterium]|nr:shikimate kinase [Clostridia bacterium]